MFLFTHSETLFSSINPTTASPVIHFPLFSSGIMGQSFEAISSNGRFDFLHFGAFSSGKSSWICRRISGKSLWFRRRFTRALVARCLFPHLVNPGEMQSFLKSPWPGDADIVSIVHHSPSNSIMSFSVQRRTCLYEETRFAERNQHLLQMALSTDSIDIHQPSWQQRISVRMGGWDKQKTKLSIYRSCKKRSIEFTLLQRTRKRTTVSTFQSIVLDTMGFYYTIWKKQNAKMAYLLYQRRLILEKENNRLHILLACKAYCKKKQRQSSLLQIICLQHMSHISAYVINYILLLCISFCNCVCTLVYE